MEVNENIYLCKIKNKYKDKETRIYYLECLRVFCSFFVILIHVSAEYYNHSVLKSYKWKISFYYIGLSKFSVPDFFMISGAVFLNRDLSYKIIFKKYIKNIYVHLIIWSTIYSLIDINFATLNIKMKLFEIFKGHYHLWYLFAIIEIYITVPFLREITKNEKLIKYFLFLYLIIVFIIPNYIYLLFYYSKSIYGLLNKLNSSFYLNTISPLHFYFAIGHYLNQKKIEENILIIIYVIGFISIIFTTTITYNFAILKNRKIIHYEPFYFNIFFTSIAIFLFFKSNCKISKFNKKLNKIILNVSKLTFGIYLIHPLIIENIARNFHLFNLDINIIILIPMLNIFIFLLSLIVSFIIKKIPLFGKYLV